MIYAVMLFLRQSGRLIFIKAMKNFSFKGKIIANRELGLRF